MRPVSEPPGRRPASPRPRPAPPGASGAAETVTGMRRALGRQLAAMRNRAGLSQWELAPMTGYSRSTLSDAELGRHRLRREFWLRCDGLLKAEGRLVASHDRIEAAAAVIGQRARDQRASARLQTVRPAGGRPDLAGRDTASSPVAMEACPHCHRPIAVLVVPAEPPRS